MAKQYGELIIIGNKNGHGFIGYVKGRNVERALGPSCPSISFPEPAIPWEGNGGSGIIRDRHTKNCMSPVLRMRWK